MPGEQVVVLGSAPDAIRARTLPRSGVDTIVAINNAWSVRPDWDWLIHPSDFSVERRPAALAPGQRLCGYETYVSAINIFGGFFYVGGTMAFTAAYWSLLRFRPRTIAFLGCDMIYAKGGDSHFYGRGTPDPLRPDPTLQSLEAKSARFQICAAELGCAVVNLSELLASRLVFPRLRAAALADFSPADGLCRAAALLTPDATSLIAEARAEEARLAYAAPDGRYWTRLDTVDPASLRRIDDLWLAAAGTYSAAA